MTKKWFKFKNRINQKTAEARAENVTCKNCETNFSGRFCPECGQAVKDYDKPFTFIFYNFAGDFFAFDTRFFRTFTALLFKPGFLTKEYFKGRRVRYAPPFRIFIFVSFILFLLLQIYTNRGLTTVLDSSYSGKDAVGLDSTSVLLADSIWSDAAVQLDSAGLEKLNMIINLETFRNTKNLRDFLDKLAVNLEEKLEVETDQKEKAKLREYILLFRSPERAMAKILELMSWAFFILLPIFALILKLFYLRRNQNYMRHLIFSIHIHSFIFILFTLIVGLYLMFNGNLETITSILLFTIPVYFVLALKRFYGQGTGKVIVKFIGVSMVYNVVFIFILGFVILNALSII